MNMQHGYNGKYIKMKFNNPHKLMFTNIVSPLVPILESRFLKTMKDGRALLWID